MKNKYWYVGIIVILIVVFSILFAPLKIEVTRDSKPYADELCNSLSDCPREVPGLKPTECKLYNNEKVCWYGGVGRCPLIHFIIPETFCTWIK